MKVLIVSSLAWIQNGCLQSLKKFERIKVNLTTFFLSHLSKLLIHNATDGNIKRQIKQIR